MRPKLKRIADQVIVITGASSGIGLATARMAARRGAKLVLAARSEDTLAQVADELRAIGAQAIHVAADVASPDDVKRIAETAIDRFGGFDTWINDAGVSIYGPLEQVSRDDHRRLFDTNYWGVVHGSLAAALHLRRRGGAIINIGSVLSDRAIPLQGAYCASKHAVKGFTDALRMELEHESAPISVTLIKPSAIDTPYKQHARSYLHEEPENPPPVYSPDLVAKAILHAAQHPVRDLTVGGGGKALASAGTFMPRFTDKLMEATFFRLQKSGRPRNPDRRDALFEPSRDPHTRGNYSGIVRTHSLFTTVRMHPFLTVATLAFGAAATGLVVWQLLSPPKRSPLRRAQRAVRPVVERTVRPVLNRAQRLIAQYT